MKKEEEAESQKPATPEAGKMQAVQTGSPLLGLVQRCAASRYLREALCFMSMGFGIGASAVVLVVLIVPFGAWCQDVIKVLAMGQVDPSYSPLSDFFRAEPSLEGTLVVSRSIHAGLYSIEQLRRFIRIYMPRSYEALLVYDFFVYDQPFLDYHDDIQIQWMYRALKERGVGALGFTQSAYPEMYVPWMSSDLSKAFPHDQERFISLSHDNIEAYNLEIVDDRSLAPVIRPYKALGIEKVKPFGYTRLLFAKEGATEWARAKDIPFKLGKTSCPLLLSWEFGDRNSRIWATGDQFVSPMWGYWWGGDGQERYALGIFTNIVWYSLRRELPSDPLLVQRLRSGFRDYVLRVGVLYSLLDFVEKFGASSQSLQQQVAGADSLVDRAGRDYLSQDFESCQTRLREAFDLIYTIEKKAVALKGRALFWVYAVEWCAVTGTFGLVAVATWTLMVGRRLYRETGVTRQL